MNKILWSKKSDNWTTPKDIYDFFVKDQNYFDPCPINPTFDGLKIKWKKKNFVNPPYSQIRLWLEKAISELPKKSIFLLPARTDTKWFHDLIYNKYHIEFIKRRLKFGNSNNSAPFPSMFVKILLNK